MLQCVSYEGDGVVIDKSTPKNQEAIGELLSTAKEYKWSIEERIVFMEYFNSFFEPKCQMKPSTTVSIMSVGQRFVTSDKCFLCNAHPRTDHLRSAKHKAKAKEDEPPGTSR